MTHDEILAKVSDIVAEIVGLDGVVLQPSTSAADVEGWDSLANVQILVSIETTFGLRFRTGEIATIRNVGELVERIAERADVR
jgi:acyl carrier protein